MKSYEELEKAYKDYCDSIEYCKDCKYKDDAYCRSRFVYDKLTEEMAKALPKVKVEGVKYRAYTYEEAKALLGKKMETFVARGARGQSVETITKVTTFEGKVYINGHSFKDLTHYDATIDGVPIGVLFIDEGETKGGEE